MVGNRVTGDLGPGEWVVYWYKSRPADLYHAGPYTVEEADMIARLFRSDDYKAQGFRGVERVSV